MTLGECTGSSSSGSSPESHRIHPWPLPRRAPRTEATLGSRHHAGRTHLLSACGGAAAAAAVSRVHGIARDTPALRESRHQVTRGSRRACAIWDAAYTDTQTHTSVSGAAGAVRPTPHFNTSHTRNSTARLQVARNISSHRSIASRVPHIPATRSSPFASLRQL